MHIHITAKTIECEIFYGVITEHSRQPAYHAILLGDDKVNICLRFFPNSLVSEERADHTFDIRFPLTERKLKALIIAPHTTLDNVEWNLKVVVVLEAEEERHAERVGVCDFVSVVDWTKVNAGRKVPFLSNKNTNDAPGERPTAHQKDFTEWLKKRATRTIIMGLRDS